MLSRYITTFIILLTSLSFDIAYAQSSPGDLMVAPTRAVFEGRNRSEVINLVNRGQKEATYRISFKNMTMNEKGKYEDITEPVRGEKFADKLVRYSPRQITLKPGESQTVRLIVRKPKDLEAGEYRSHLLFRALPPENTGDSIEDENLKEGEIAIKLVPIFGISIPVIIRHGITNYSATISDIDLIKEKDDNFLSFDINRKGNMSVSGNIEIVYNTTNGKKHIISKERRATVLYPYPKKSNKIKLQLPDGVVLNKGKITVKYYSEKDNIQKPINTATYSLP